MSITYEIMKSWSNRQGNVNSMATVLDWIKARNETLKVEIEKDNFSYDGFWYLDQKDGWVRNRNNSFFQLAGYRETVNGQISCEQPVIIQNEIGYLGIICKMIHGTLNFLMQAKIEPGNVNVIQLSPTIQATKSNFTKKHGGAAPAYLDYFIHAENHTIVVDQLQSEQSSRFYKKRNRNMILLVDDDVEVLSSHIWMTLGQIKECLKIDNLVNMDTRTVLSCIPYVKSELEEGEYEEIQRLLHDSALCASMFKEPDQLAFHHIFHKLNNAKMYRESKSELVPLSELSNWEMTPREIRCKTDYDFKIVYCKIEIEGREVKRWEQPLVEALGTAVFGIFTCVKNGIRKFLVRLKPEIGCFDHIELGPSIQLEPSNTANRLTALEQLFISKLERGDGVVKSVILSEEGGRFYHEQNQNVIIEIKPDEIETLPEDCVWADFSTINSLIQFNNCVNIQLRNLTALID